jgi:hypothetical protein
MNEPHCGFLIAFGLGDDHLKTPSIGGVFRARQFIGCELEGVGRADDLGNGQETGLGLLVRDSPISRFGASASWT